MINPLNMYSVNKTIYSAGFLAFYKIWWTKTSFDQFVDTGSLKVNSYVLVLGRDMRSYDYKEQV